MRVAHLAQMFVALVIASAGLRAVGADDPPTDLDKARLTYDKAREKHRTELLKHFDDELDRIPKQKLAAEERAKRIDIVKAEKERFEKEGLIPWSESMRAHLAGYQKNLALAETSLRKAFDREIDRALKAKNAEEVNRLRADLAKALDANVVATWSHKPPPGLPPGTLRLYSNGKIGSPDAKATWSFQGGTLTLRWPDPTAPGGAWLDVCPVSADGQSYAGKNQNGSRMGGSYVAKEP
jgi:hypothetical protein